MVASILKRLFAKPAPPEPRFYDMNMLWGKATTSAKPYERNNFDNTHTFRGVEFKYFDERTKRATSAALEGLYDETFVKDGDNVAVVLFFFEILGMKGADVVAAMNRTNNKFILIDFNIDKHAKADMGGREQIIKEIGLLSVEHLGLKLNF